MDAAPADPGAPRRRGRPALRRTAPLEPDEILTTALEIVKRESIDALSMRRLASDLGVTPMALYHHIPDKPALIAALVERVWKEMLRRPPEPSDDLVDFIVNVCVRTREIWLEYADLAPYAVAVSPADDDLMRSTRGFASILESIGVADVPLAYNAIQNFMMGSVLIAAHRRSSSAYFGRDPKKVLAAARRMLTRANATPNHRGLVEARFDEGDELHYENAVRALLAGLLAPRDDEGS